MHHTISKPIHNLIYPYVPNRTVAGWSSPVARQAHNLKVTGSNPVPATKSYDSPDAKASGLSSFVASFFAGK